LRPVVIGYSVRSMTLRVGLTISVVFEGTRPRTASAAPGRTPPMMRWKSPTSSAMMGMLATLQPSASTSVSTSPRKLRRLNMVARATQRTRTRRVESNFCVSALPSHASSDTTTGFCSAPKVRIRLKIASPSLYVWPALIQS